MAVSLIALLEVIHIYHQQSHWNILLARDLEIARDMTIEGSPNSKAGDSIHIKRRHKDKVSERFVLQDMHESFWVGFSVLERRDGHVQGRDDIRKVILIACRSSLRQETFFCHRRNKIREMQINPAHQLAE